ncbi:ATP-binding protein [Streptomyces subrutilus]|uniref:ATP-binding protein n=1 Tax=Streptomyces subrutilus TaxID=36818 RepID=A0A5P2UG53_9ACTN|nr:hypothetical protein [Streptomyces subrutilus]QEU78152.1 hypothetical protein CP968_07525 [Streptomyces subrutilus]GGZ55576.1 ATP-binding protein [Streptomyces subrutilus]
MSEDDAQLHSGQSAHRTGELPESAQINSANQNGIIYAVQNGNQTINQSGSVEPDPWVLPDDYLSQVNKGPIYTHRWQLVGRAQTMDTLVPFAQHDQGGIAFLVGRGGVGKTKIVTSLCEALRGTTSGVEVRLLDTRSVISPGAFRNLPSTSNLLVIVDDAHDSALPLGQIVSGVRSVNGSANVLLSLRPYGMTHARRALAQAGVHVSETTVVEIGDLEFQEALSLAGEILNEAGKFHAPRLAAAARDCPLLIVTGAALINGGALDPRRFEGDEQLHVELTGRLAEALTSYSAPEQVPQELLYALAAFQPVRLAEPEVRTSLEALTGLTFDLCAQHLTTLEHAGVVLSRNTAVRLVPDLLGDALLIRAARHHGTGLPTGYLARAMKAAQGSALTNLVVNAGRVDWQQQQGTDAGVLIEPLWEQIAAAFRTTDAREQVSILEIVAKVAFFQPRRALDLAAWAVENPCAPVTAEVGFGFAHTWTDTDVRHALASVLRAAAHHPSFLPQAATLLWGLGRDDSRLTPQHPSHPLRILEELAGYTRWGPTEYQRILVAQVERWLTRAPITPSIHQPLKVLAPLLATDGHDEMWTPATWSLSFRPYVLEPAPEVLDIRGQVLDLAFAELGNPQIERASAAISLVGDALGLPRGSFGLMVSDSMREPWIPHLVSVVDRLRRYIVEHVLPPAILVAVRTELHWLARYGPDDARRAAKDALHAIPASPENELARALHGGPTDPASFPEYSDWLAARDVLFSNVRNALVDWTDSQVVLCINSLFGEENRVFGADSGRARPFIWTLVTHRPSIGEAVCEQALATPDSSLTSLVSVALAAMGQAASGRAVLWGRTLMNSGNTQLTREAAHAFGIQRGRGDLVEDEADLLRELAAHGDSIVRRATRGAVRAIADQHKELAVELLTASPAVEVADLEEFARALAGPPFSPLGWSDLSEDQQGAFLTALTAVPSIEGYDIGRFLAELARTEPFTVVELLQSRVELYSHEQSAGYSPLPFAWHVSPPFRDHDDFTALLRQIRDWLAADPNSALRHYLGAKLFALVAGSYDARVVETIDEWLDDSDPVKIKVTAALVSKAPRTLVWDAEFVRRCLRAADRHGDASLNRMRNALHSAVITGMRSGTPGQPFPEDVEEHAKATELADRCAKASVEEQFYRDIAESALRRVQDESDDTPPDGRDW